MSTEVSSGALPLCAVHPEAFAGATCQRCGSFICTPCTTWVMGRMYCPTCAARPEVSYLETFRLQLWGRRDAGAWMVGLGTVTLAGLAVVALLAGDFALGLALWASVGVGTAFFLGQPWARLALLALPLAAMLLTARSLGAPALLFFVPFTIALNLFRDTRSRLFFRLDIPERELHRLWDRQVNNPLARHALALGVGSLSLPVFSPLMRFFSGLSVLLVLFVVMAMLAMVLGSVALRRVDLDARPPIGRRWEALVGMGLGLLSLGVWGTFYGARTLELLVGLAD
ncbi:hypothetical protein [Comamonas sp. JC664]|uniref:hypothetical protein n=1 Tax=Comamonas sp. JC664 TaxID=2801917 RepID=UPI00174D1CFA|nr:hypothetical protein [Comamonas sp. JC664]MBL0698126.1 hypothetical protein [Comamonas sp. JC664]GHG88487.1 hypothetical protein GCM10012319_47160 [Comamonas sp. KCTC 72670]